MFYNIQVTYLGKCDIPIIASCVRCAKKAMPVINVLISVYLTVLPSSRKKFKFFNDYYVYKTFHFSNYRLRISFKIL